MDLASVAGAYPDRYGDSDLACTVEFCAATPATPAAWGRIKAVSR